MLRTLFAALAITATASPALADDDGKIPKVDFPAVGTTAKAGQKVFTMNALQLKGLATARAPGVVLYLGEVIEPGKVTSKIKGIGKDPDSVPNSTLVPIAAGSTAKVGDIIIAPWASSMMRAIVINAKNPKSPVVLFIDLAFDNPAKNKAGVGVAQEENTVLPDTFFQVGKTLGPGAIAGCKKDKDVQAIHVVRVEGDSVLGQAHAGILSVFKKGDCTAIEAKSSFKVGDKVFANFVGTFKEATVTKVDAKAGRVFVNYSFIKNKEYGLQVGEVVAKLP